VFKAEAEEVAWFIEKAEAEFREMKKDPFFDKLTNRLAELVRDLKARPSYGPKAGRNKEDTFFPKPRNPKHSDAAKTHGAPSAAHNRK